MKFLHLGDLHLGKSLGNFDLIKDQEYFLDWLIDLASENSVDAILIAGDVYDKAIPSEAATGLLDYFLSKLAEINVHVYMVSGNHDSDERLNYGSCLFEKNNVYISSKYDGTLCKHTLKTNDEEVDIYLLPFVKASQVKHYLTDAKIENYDDAVRAVIESARIDKSRKNILVAHQFVTKKSTDPILAGSEGLKTQTVGLVEKIEHSCFDDFDYVALGHIHSPQEVGRPEIRYAGSPIKYSLSEVNNNKSVPLITVNDTELNIELIPIKPLRDMKHIRGKLKDLLKESNIKDTDDFIYVTLTDEELQSNAMNIFQQYYLNTVKIDFDNSHTREIEYVDISNLAEKRSFNELINDFYTEVYGENITEEEMDIMKEVAREAGVLHEAD